MLYLSIASTSGLYHVETRPAARAAGMARPSCRAVIIRPTIRRAIRLQTQPEPRWPQGATSLLGYVFPTFGSGLCNRLHAYVNVNDLVFAADPFLGRIVAGRLLDLSEFQLRAWRQNELRLTGFRDGYA